MRLSDAIVEYQTFRTSQRYSKSYVRTERQALDILLAEVGNIQVRSLDARHGETFIAALLSKGMKPGTVNLYRGAFRRFCAWCHQRRYLPGASHPLGTTRNLADHAAPKRRLPVTDFGRLLDATEHPQERIIVALGLYLFLRASEVSALDIEHVRLAQSEIVVYQPKTKRWDEMPICEELDTELRRWMTWYAEDQAPVRGPLLPHWPLVPARSRSVLANDGTGKNGGRPVLLKHGQMNPGSRVRLVHKKVQKSLRAIGWDVTADDREGVHTLRRSGARALYEDLSSHSGEARDEAVGMVQAMLHHKTRAQTEHYIGLEASREKRDRVFKGVRMFRVADTGNVVMLPAVAE
jgi:integrase